MPRGQATEEPVRTHAERVAIAVEAYGDPPERPVTDPPMASPEERQEAVRRFFRPLRRIAKGCHARWLDGEPDKDVKLRFLVELQESRWKMVVDKPSAASEQLVGCIRKGVAKLRAKSGLGTIRLRFRLVFKRRE